MKKYTFEKPDKDRQPFLSKRAVGALAGVAIAIAGANTDEGRSVVSSVRDSLAANPAEMMREDAQTDSRVQDILRTGEQTQNGTEAALTDAQKRIIVQQIDSGPVNIVPRIERRP